MDELSRGRLKLFDDRYNEQGTDNASQRFSEILHREFDARVGLNHIDPSPLRYESNGDLWSRKYGNSMLRWLVEAVRPDLKACGFNSVGWTQEVVTLVIRRYDREHLILGDRYEAGKGIISRTCLARESEVERGWPTRQPDQVHH